MYGLYLLLAIAALLLALKTTSSGVMVLCMLVALALLVLWLAGLYSARNPLPCSPHSRPPYFAVSATTSSEICFISTSCCGSHMSSAGRTCSTPASTWPNMP